MKRVTVEILGPKALGKRGPEEKGGKGSILVLFILLSLASAFATKILRLMIKSM